MLLEKTREASLISARRIEALKKKLQKLDLYRFRSFVNKFIVSFFNQTFLTKQKFLQIIHEIENLNITRSDTKNIKKGSKNIDKKQIDFSVEIKEAKVPKTV